MPDQWERHSEHKYDWGTGPARRDAVRGAVQDQVADPQPAKQPAVHKDRTICKATKQPHDYQIVPLWTWPSQCGWRPGWKHGADGKYVIGWSCRHGLVCGGCGKKILGKLGGESCPDYPGVDEQREAAQREADVWTARRLEQRGEWHRRVAARNAAKSRRTAYRKPKTAK